MVLNENAQTFDAGCQFLIDSCSRCAKIAYCTRCCLRQRIAKKEKIVSVTIKKWVLNTVEKLSAAEIEELKRYLEYLVWKSEIPTERLGPP